MRRVCGGVTAAVYTTGSRSLNCLRVITEVWLGGHRVSVNRDKPVVVGTFEVHINNPTTPDIFHFRSEDCRNVAKLARPDSVTSILGEEDWDRVILVLLCEVFVARTLERVVSTPLVHVVTEEIDSGGLISAVEIV